MDRYKSKQLCNCRDSWLAWVSGSGRTLVVSINLPMPINQSPSVGEVRGIVVGYTSPGAGTFEFIIDASVFAGGFELTYVIAIIHLVRAIASLIKVSQANS